MKTSKKIFLTILVLFIGLNIYSQTVQNFNFDFENIENGKPKYWESFDSKNYVFTLDSNISYSGKYAVSIEYKEGTADFSAWEFTIPENYNGKQITLSGYLKTENVSDGYVGLYMRIDPSIAFDNMYRKNIKGTTDWTKYEITLNMNPKKTKRIVLGGILVGKGKMWMDNLSVSIDGKNITDLKPIEAITFPADKDKEFENGSGITINTIDSFQIEKLKNLGLIWGFLKYYHPNIAKGEYNWDYELFRILPKVLNSNNQNNLDSFFVNWINNLGKFTLDKKAEIKNTNTKLEPDLTWIKNSNYSDQLKALLLKIKNAQRTKEQYYIGLEPYTTFKHENPYTSMQYTDAGYRLLSLYRYWNIIQYYFPYKYLIEEDWKNVLKEFIPKYLQSNNETDYTFTVLELIERINDTHANIWGENEVLENYYGINYAPVELSYVQNKVVVTGYFDKKLGKQTGLEIGDIISSVNNKAVEELIKERLKIYPASNYTTKLRNITLDLLRTNDSTLNIEFIRLDKAETKKINTYPSSEINIFSRYENSDTCFKLINKDIAYLNNGSIKLEYLPKIWRAIRNTKGLIIDLRNYPSEFPLYDLSEYLMPKSTPFVKFTKASIENPGQFTFNKTTNIGKDNKNYYNGKVIILVNEVTQSSGEFHAMAYRVHPKAIVIGSTTAGADGNVSQIILPGKIRTMISGIGVYYPNGKETQRIGILPDFEVKPTINGIREKRDELIEKAKEIIYKK